ncbi:MAG: hypothetical protein PHD07_07945 [Bacteroidales bacterium]|nr:hypothetical protein [Bacteroidales bacterium]MDD3201961.1 hypothetical protein [Bacteroidales bacterium]
MYQTFITAKQLPDRFLKVLIDFIADFAQKNPDAMVIEAYSAIYWQSIYLKDLYDWKGSIKVNMSINHKWDKGKIEVLYRQPGLKEKKLLIIQNY